MSTNHNLFKEKGEPKRYRTDVLPLTSLTLLPLGQTGSSSWTLCCFQSYQYPNLSEGADRVGGQLCGDKRVPLQWRNQFRPSLDQGAEKRCSECGLPQTPKHWFTTSFFWRKCLKAMLGVLVECCFTSTETVGLLGRHLDFHTAPGLCSEFDLPLAFCCKGSFLGRGCPMESILMDAKIEEGRGQYLPVRLRWKGSLLERGCPMVNKQNGGC